MFSGYFGAEDSVGSLPHAKMSCPVGDEPLHETKRTVLLLLLADWYIATVEALADARDLEKYLNSCLIRTG